MPVPRRGRPRPLRSLAPPQVVVGVGGGITRERGRRAAQRAQRLAWWLRLLRDESQLASYLGCISLSSAERRSSAKLKFKLAKVVSLRQAVTPSQVGATMLCPSSAARMVTPVRTTPSTRRRALHLPLLPCCATSAASAIWHAASASRSVPPTHSRSVLAVARPSRPSFRPKLKSRLNPPFAWIGLLASLPPSYVFSPTVTCASRTHTRENP